MSAYEDRLRQIAEEEGVAWDAVRRVILSEGGLRDPYRRSEAPGEYSLGPLQLNMRRGVGANALKEGIDASKDWEAAYRYGLRHAKKVGWLGDWMGARKIGIGNREGLGGADDARATAKYTRRHVGGAGSKPENFGWTETTGGGAQPPQTAGGGGQYNLPKEEPKKSAREQLGDAIKTLGGDLNADLGMGQAPAIPQGQFYGGEAMPSVLRMPFQPAQAPLPSGGGDLRAILAQLLQGGGRGSI